MEDVPQPPVRAPPPLPLHEAKSGIEDGLDAKKLAIRVVSNDSVEEENATNPAQATQAYDARHSSSGYIGTDKELPSPPAKMSHGILEPVRPPPPPPPHHQTSGYTQSPSVKFEKLASPKSTIGDAYRPESPRIVLPDENKERQPESRNVSYGGNYSYGSNETGQSGHTKSASVIGVPAELTAELHYHHRPLSEAYVSGGPGKRSSQTLSPTLDTGSRGPNSPISASHLRPTSSYSSLDSSWRERSGSLDRPSNMQRQSPSIASPARKSPDTRPLSYIDLLNVPYPQQAPAPMNLNHTHLKTSIGTNVSLLSPMKTLEMYRANVKKTNDLTVQHEFALFMLETAQEAASNPSKFPDEELGENVPNPTELVKEARQILQRLSDRSYPFAQYYLADGYASGLFNKGKEDNDRAFPLFVAASKRGHVESGYRAALSYEFGWGTRKDPLKAVQFYRQSASKNHPGAMTRLARACLTGDLGLGVRYKEGVKWLKRATESADQQYNTAPYELGLLHETGYGDDVFQDEQYAAQLFTQAAGLGHVEANYKLGDAYEHGKLQCPKDPALSIHFYNGAATRGYGPAMMALCAWYMVGAEPALARDESEAYEWAKKAAHTGK